MRKTKTAPGARARHTRSRTVLPDSTRIISATDASKNFGALAQRVQLEGLVFLVRRHGQPVAQIVPVDIPHCTVSALRDLLTSRPLGDENYLRFVARGVARGKDDTWAR